MRKTNPNIRDGRSESPDELQSVLMNRHPIYDSNLQAAGYEPRAAAGIGGPALLTLLAENFAILTGNSWGLVTLPRQAILAEHYKVLPKERTIIEVRNGPADQRLIASLATLRALGYRLAVPLADTGLRAIAGQADVLRLKLGDAGSHALNSFPESPLRRKTKLLVSGIESYEDFECSKDMGFDLFQGSFVCAPKVTVRSVPMTNLATVRLLGALQDPEVRIEDLEEIIRYDVLFSYKLLRFVNSVNVGLHHEVASIKHAVSLAGIERIRRWASLLLFASVKQKPRELLFIAAVRARMCEQLADSDNEHRQATFFTTGLLSVLDALLDQPMAKALEGLSLSEEIQDALVNRSGALGTALRAVIAYEQGDWERHALLRFRPAKLRHSYLDSLHWTQTVTSGLMI